MLVVLEAARLLNTRDPSSLRLAPGEARYTFTDFRPPNRPSRLGAAVARGVSRLGAVIREQFERRAVIRELSTKDNRLLADIGITREQIEEVASLAAKRGPHHAAHLLSSAAPTDYEAVAVEAVANDNAPRIAA